MATFFKDATLGEVNEALETSAKAFKIYKQRSLVDRAAFLKTIAKDLEAESAILIETAQKETALTTARLKIELTRTIFQLTSYATACEEGTWLDARIDTGGKDRNPPKPDLRKYLIPLGPVAVFGASNFPFAYSTAGEDTACALAAGCTVVVKAHPAHAQTSQLVANIINGAAKKCGLPPGVFIHLHGAAFEIGKALVEHPFTRAVGFTGSFEGGKALFDIANRRENPIPVFAEMGSVNPVFILPQKLKNDFAAIATMYSASITQSAGQFCTNPGILVAVEGEGLEEFKILLGEKIKSTAPERMLHSGIAKSFKEKRATVLQHQSVVVLAETEKEFNEEESIPTLAQVSAESFLADEVLQKEVFGPFSILVVCKTIEEMMQVAYAMEGQLTTTVMVLEEEVDQHTDLIEILKEKCGRMIMNGVPTGVEVALAMHHGGPYPATTDSRFGAVGADGIKRFARPICFQNWKNEFLPEELKNENPLNIWRTVNNELTKKRIV